MFDTHDPFADLSGRTEDAGEVLDFEQTYDGFGQQLNEEDDAFNDDTFGDDQPLSRDFDFAGQTAKIRDTLLEEQALHHARQPTMPNRAQKPTRTGYEAYKQPEYIPKLEADASIWGPSVAKKTTESQPPEQTHTVPASMMSLEEVEAAMRARARPTPPVPDVHSQTQGLKSMLGLGGARASPPVPPQHEQQRPVQILQRPQPQEPPPRQEPPDYNIRAPQILQRQQSPQVGIQQHQDPRGQISRPMPYPQVPDMPPGMGRAQHPQGPMPQVAHQRGPSYTGPPINRAQQMMQMAPGDRETYLAEEAKRAKRNHKIFLLSRNNGLMTPQDKNFITRIQLQQLVTATGGVDNELGSEEQLAEDFYYQVYAQIRGPPRSEPGQPLNQFAQTYLFQTGSRYGYGRSRHHPRGGDNHVQRMEQQVARAVEAAKARPKNKQLVVEGSLGKIAFSNSKTPRPLLNIKRPDSAVPGKQPHRPVSGADRKTALRNIEHIYATMMKLEDHERKLPPPPKEDSPPEIIEGHMMWRSEMQELNEQLWEALKVMEAVQSE